MITRARSTRLADGFGAVFEPCFLSAMPPRVSRGRTLATACFHVFNDVPSIARTMRYTLWKHAINRARRSGNRTCGPGVGTLPLLHVTATHAKNDQSQTYPTEPHELLPEQKQREQRAHQRFNTGCNGSRRRVDTFHGGEEEKVGGEDRTDPECGDVNPRIDRGGRGEGAADERDHEREHDSAAQQLVEQNALRAVAWHRVTGE